MPKATIVVPAYNVAKTIGETITSLLSQTYTDFEIIVVDDGGSDRSVAIARSFGDRRIRIIQQPNRGLAGARNTGIAHARGDYIGFCDADDLWRPGKLAAHVEHLDANPEVGLSFSGSQLIDSEGAFMKLAQTPRLTGITAAHVFRRNPVGNGSSAVMRRAALDDIAWRPAAETHRDWWFDESYRQSEDIECWLRLSLITDWQIEGVRGLLTQYRIVSGGLSAATDRQYASWERMVTKLSAIAPDFFERHAGSARAYQLRYLARRAVASGDGRAAFERIRQAFRSSVRPLWEEPVKTSTTLLAAAGLVLLGPTTLTPLRRFSTHPS